MALYSESQQQYLLDAINKENPDAVLPADLSNCIIGKPRAIVKVLPTDPNTEITIRGRQRRGYNGSQTFRYTRLSLADLFKNIVPIITLPGIYYMQQAVKNINGRYGLNLVDDEVINYRIYSQSASTLTTNGESLQWTGSARVIYKPGKWDLEELVANNILDVMSFPIDPEQDKKCATMLGYGIDFSEEGTFLQTISNGTLSLGPNFTSGRSAVLSDLMLQAGLPAWDMKGAKVSNVRPSQDPRANPMYDRVLVISNVFDLNVDGDWLLHYNI